ncbi:hypothetical protein CONLIGDRAFT_293852 [Coniochaeta ligniaria NRRL 30616]|uniref:Uncharacterized protein n=1 Tax=Coniochaeta ligniaria NRRL 30616 TaxID=1408157 RepID=A0A1J7ITB7_9PEZI|nr:hypothetical protein CONLIGDRAFT_293852 [Coniochaeta ligniaria NRRL 30616]
MGAKGYLPTPGPKSGPTTRWARRNATSMMASASHGVPSIDRSHQPLSTAVMDVRRRYLNLPPITSRTLALEGRPYSSSVAWVDRPGVYRPRRYCSRRLLSVEVGQLSGDRQRDEDIWLVWTSRDDKVYLCGSGNGDTKWKWPSLERRGCRCQVISGTGSLRLVLQVIGQLHCDLGLVLHSGRAAVARREDRW